jgi:hypothetical protein
MSESGEASSKKKATGPRRKPERALARPLTFAAARYGASDSPARESEPGPDALLRRGSAALRRDTEPSLPHDALPDQAPTLAGSGFFHDFSRVPPHATHAQARPTIQREIRVDAPEAEHERLIESREPGGRSGGVEPRAAARDRAEPVGYDLSGVPAHTDSKSAQGPPAIRAALPDLAAVRAGTVQADAEQSQDPTTPELPIEDAKFRHLFQELMKSPQFAKIFKELAGLGVKIKASAEVGRPGGERPAAQYDPYTNTVEIAPEILSSRTPITDSSTLEKIAHELKHAHQYRKISMTVKESGGGEAMRAEMITAAIGEMGYERFRAMSKKSEMDAEAFAIRATLEALGESHDRLKQFRSMFGPEKTPDDYFKFMFSTWWEANESIYEESIKARWNYYLKSSEREGEQQTR